MQITPLPENRICVISTKTSIDNTHQIALARIDPYHIKALILKYDKKVSEAGPIEGMVFKHFWLSSYDSRYNHQDSAISLMARVESKLKTIYGSLPKRAFLLNTVEIDKDTYVHILSGMPQTRAPSKPPTKIL